MRCLVGLVLKWGSRLSKWNSSVNVGRCLGEITFAAISEHLGRITVSFCHMVWSKSYFVISIHWYHYSFTQFMCFKFRQCTTLISNTKAQETHTHTHTMHTHNAHSDTDTPSHHHNYSRVSMSVSGVDNCLTLIALFTASVQPTYF